MSRHLERRVTMEACEPAELLKEPSGVSIRLLPRWSLAPGCDEVELRGNHPMLTEFIEKHWGPEYLELLDELA